MNRQNTVKADFLVATVPLSSVDDELLGNFARMSVDGEFRRFYGYAGFLKDNFFIGDNGDRVLFQATGSRAEDIIPLIETTWAGLSVARLDIQLTVLVADADAVISRVFPSKAYKAVRMLNLGERGATLYVGSPKSRVRLRMYNKTAESGESLVSGMERMRIELQLRDEYADRGLINLKAGAGDMFFRYYVTRMTDGYTTAIVDRAFKDSDMLAMVETCTEKSDDTRKAWLEHSVIPAIMKLAAYDKPFVKDFLARLKEILD
jgi:hypothetical protein